MKGDQGVHSLFTFAVGECLHEETEQFSLTGYIQLGVGVLSVQFHGLGGDRQLFRNQPRAVPQKHHAGDLLLPTRQQ